MTVQYKLCGDSRKSASFSRPSTEDHMQKLLANIKQRRSKKGCKKVSFGDNPVKTFLYEQESEDVTPMIGKQAFTDPNAPVTRVQITTEETIEVPAVPIPPPAQLDDIRKSTASPPLPWIRKMDNEHENPFRPQDGLYHEVDPIVEAYLHKPFPASQPSSTNVTPVKRNGSGVNGVDGTRSGGANNSPGYLQNGLSKEQLVLNEKMAQQQPLLENMEGSEKRSSRDQSVPLSAGGASDGYSELPAPGQVELVHIKKKKCGCCSLQ